MTQLYGIEIFFVGPVKEPLNPECRILRVEDKPTTKEQGE